MSSTTTVSTLPGVGTWVIDASHSSVEFVARHLMVSKVRGRFGAFSGTVEVADPLEGSVVEVTIEAASFDSGDEQRDGHVKSADFLDVEQFPTLTFKGANPRAKGDAWVLPGELTIRGTTRPVELEVEALGLITDPWGNEKAAFTATTEIDREEFGIVWNAALEAGGVLVGQKVRIELDVQLGRQA
jgi:polyisoprenoid-binding protein YceI